MHSRFCSVSIISIVLLICNVGFASHLQWHRLTEDNFTSDIRNHPFVVCISTVPWCGESRSIMKDLVKSIEADQKLHSAVELRVIFANLDKDLGVAVLGRRKTPALTFYLHATPYKYKGRLKVHNILAAMHRGIFVSSGDFPFRRLDSKLDVEKFLEFTQKAVILYDICNYAEMLGGRNWRRMVNKGSDTIRDVTGELPSSFHENQEIFYGCANANVNAGTLQSDERQFVSSPMSDVLQGRLLNDSATSNLSSADENEIVTSRISTRNTVSERFLDSENSRLLAVDADKGLTSETCTSFSENLLHAKSDMLDQSMGCQIEISSSYQSSCYHRNSSSLTDFGRASLSIRNFFYRNHGCNSTDYRHFATLYQNLTKLARNHILTPERMDFAIIRDKQLLLDLGISKMQNNSWLLIIRTMDQPKTPKIYPENQTLDSFIFHSGQLMSELNYGKAQYHSTLIEGKPTAILFIDRASPLHEVRVKSWDALRAFQRVFEENQAARESKLNGYQSDVKELQKRKVNIKTLARKELFGTMANVKASLGNSDSNQATLERYQPEIHDEKARNEGKNLHEEIDHRDNTVVVRVLFGEQNMQMEGSLLKTSSGNFQSLDLTSILFSEDNVVYESQSEEIGKEIVYRSPMDEIRSISLQSSSEVDIPVKSVSENLQDLNYMPSLSYFFSDGDDSIKEILLPGLSYPCLLILDSSKSGQFVFPVNVNSLSYATIKTFINQFSRRLLKRVHQSGVAPQDPRQQVKPPFVNRDFHVMNGVPQISMMELSEMRADSGMADCALILTEEEEICRAKKRDIYVHFTLAACGFCKRMELIFREMHKLLTLHLDAHLKSKASCPNGDWNSLKENLPLLFQIDCTINECTLFFEDIDQEKYPSVIFFSKSRDNKRLYGGGPTMQGLLEFIAYQSNIDMEILQMLQGYQQHF